MCPRLVHADARRELQKRDEAWLEDRAGELAGSQESIVRSNIDEVDEIVPSLCDVRCIRQTGGVCESSSEGRSRNRIEVVGRQDRSESKRRWNSTQGRGSTKIQQ